MLFYPNDAHNEDDDWEKEETGGGVQEVGGEGGEDFITICDTRVIDDHVKQGGG